LHHRVVAVVTQITELAKANQEVNDKTEDGPGMIVRSVGTQMAEATAQPIIEIQPLKQELEDEQSGEGGQLLVFES